jgi:hypothetical protein
MGSAGFSFSIPINDPLQAHPIFIVGFLVDSYMEMQSMTEDDYAHKLDELGRLLNDPTVPLQPTLVWRLLDDISKHEADTTRSHGDIVAVAAFKISEQRPASARETEAGSELYRG